MQALDRLTLPARACLSTRLVLQLLHDTAAQNKVMSARELAKQFSPLLLRSQQWTQTATLSDLSRAGTHALVPRAAPPARPASPRPAASPRSAPTRPRVAASAQKRRSSC